MADSSSSLNQWQMGQGNIQNPPVPANYYQGNSANINSSGATGQIRPGTYPVSYSPTQSYINQASAAASGAGKYIWDAASGGYKWVAAAGAAAVGALAAPEVVGGAIAYGVVATIAGAVTSKVIDSLFGGSSSAPSQPYSDSNANTTAPTTYNPQTGAPPANSNPVPTNMNQPNMTLGGGSTAPVTVGKATYNPDGSVNISVPSDGQGYVPPSNNTPPYSGKPEDYPDDLSTLLKDADGYTPHNGVADNVVEGIAVLVGEVRGLRRQIDTMTKVNLEVAKATTQTAANTGVSAKAASGGGNDSPSPSPSPQPTFKTVFTDKKALFGYLMGIRSGSKLNPDPYTYWNGSTFSGYLSCKDAGAGEICNASSALMDAFNNWPSPAPATKPSSSTGSGDTGGSGGVQPTKPTTGQGQPTNTAPQGQGQNPTQPSPAPQGQGQTPTQPSQDQGNFNLEDFAQQQYRAYKNQADYFETFIKPTDEGKTGAVIQLERDKLMRDDLKFLTTPVTVNDGKFKNLDDIEVTATPREIEMHGNLASAVYHTDYNNYKFAESDFPDPIQSIMDGLPFPHIESVAANFGVASLGASSLSDLSSLDSILGKAMSGDMTGMFNLEKKTLLEDGAFGT